MAHPRGWDWLEDEILSLKTVPVDIVVSLLTNLEVSELGLLNEKKLCQLNRLDYRNLPIPDRDTPSLTPATLNFIEQLYLALCQGKHVVIHCRAGIGRSALIAASVLVRAGFSVEDAFDILASARGRSVPDTVEQREWVIKFGGIIRPGSPG